MNTLLDRELYSTVLPIALPNNISRRCVPKVPGERKVRSVD